MRRYLLVTTTAGAVLAAGLIAVPALAAGPSTTTTTGTPSATPTRTPTDTTTYPCDAVGGRGGMQNGRGPGMQNGRGPGMGRNGMVPGNGMMPGNGMGAGGGMGAGMGRGGNGSAAVDPLAGLTQGTLTADQKAALSGMAEEEKLAHDVYVALAAATKDPRFTRISTAESRHLTEVRALLTRYGITDPTAGKADGAFATPAIQQQYKDFVARGSASLDAALAVGRDIENADLAALDKARTGVTAPDVSTVYTRLSNGSRMHLRAFGG